MLKKTIKLLIAILIFMFLNKVYAYNDKLIINNNFKSDTILLNLDKVDKAKVKVNVINSITKEPITNNKIKFQIKNINTDEYICENENCLYQIDSSGSFVTTNYLENGEYSLELIENQDLTNYLWNDIPLDFTISEDIDYTYIENEPVLVLDFNIREAKGGFIINLIGEFFSTKDNRITFEDYPLSSSRFKLYAADDIYSANNTLIYSKDELVKELKYTANDYKTVDLYFGKYYLKQVSSSLGNKILTEPYYFEIKYLDKYTEYAITEFELRNYLPKGDIVITNIDSETDSPIKNTKINVYTDKDELIYTGFTDEFGKLIVPRLATIKYYYIEEDSPGYIINNDKVFFEITEDNQVIESIIKNDIIKGTFIFTKTDYTTNEPLKDAAIGIYNENDELLYTETTNELGQIIINDIKYGRYYYQELTPPEGYTLNEEKVYFEIRENGEIVEGNMMNEKTEAPNTYQNESYLWLLFSVIIFLIGGLIFLYAQKKN